MRTLAGLCLLIMVLLAGGCAWPKVDSGFTSQQPVDFFRPVATEVKREIKDYPASGHARLGYFHYQPLRYSDSIGIIYLHGIESHAGWFEGPAYRLAALGYDVYSLDRRGSGINRESRGFTSGHVDSFQTLIEDLHAFFQHIQGRHKRHVVVGLSWGGKLALAYAIAYPQDLDALVLITPGLAARVDLSWRKKLGVLAALAFNPQARFATPIEVPMFTADPYWQGLIRRDPLRLRAATARFFFESRRLDRTIRRGIERNSIPILLVLAGHDRIVDNPAIVCLLGRGRQPAMNIRLYEDQTHSIQFEAPARLVRDMHDWMGGGQARPPWVRPGKAKEHHVHDRQVDRADHAAVGAAF